MMFDRRSALLLLGIGFLALPAAAEPSADFAAARRFIQGKQADLARGLRNAREPKTDPGLLRIFDGMLDYPHFVRHSLGEHWDALSEAERQRFGDVLRKLIQGSYRRNLRDISGYSVDYTGEAEGQDGVVVATRASDPKKKRAAPLSIDYVVGKTADGLRVRDIVTGGVSLLTNYRRQFGRIIKRQSFAALLQKMEAQLENLEQP